MENNPVLFFVLLFASLIATCVIWLRVLPRKEPIWHKLLCLLISAVPFFGPLFYAFFFDPPPVSAMKEQQAEHGAWGTRLIPTFSPLINSIRKFFPD